MRSHTGSIRTAIPFLQALRDEWTRDGQRALLAHSVIRIDVDDDASRDDVTEWARTFGDALRAGLRRDDHE